MPARRRLIAANWKMNTRLQSGTGLSRFIAEWALKQGELPYDLLLCPPYQLLMAIGETLKGSPVKLGAQNCHWASHGPFTGEISATQLADVGCDYVILGHSERRQGSGESNADIASKVEAAQKAGLTPILCLGETAEQKERGMADAVIQEQLQQSLPEQYNTTNIVIAYEPIWAIGTGIQPEVKEIVHTNQLIRKTLGAHGDTVRILYGGSVAPGNAALILSSPEVDGALIGSAGLSADGFISIAEKAA